MIGVTAGSKVPSQIWGMNVPAARLLLFSAGTASNRKRTVKAVLTRSNYLEFGQALIAETVANVGQEELAF